MRRAILLALLWSAPPAFAAECVQVVSTNDVHGHLTGLATFGGYVASFRAKYRERVLLVDAGDLFQGTLASNASHGAAVIAAYNALGYHATAVGNHDFDFGAESDPKDSRGALEARIAEARFPFLACNVFEKGSGERPAWVKPSTMVNAGGIPVGVVGAITRSTPDVTNPVNVADLDFRSGVHEVAAEAAALKAKGARVLVLVAHMGGTELLELIKALPHRAIDVAIAGHTHEFFNETFEGVAVTQSGAEGHAFGWTEACVGPGGRVTTAIHGPVMISASGTFLDQSVSAMTSVEKAIEPFAAKVHEQEVQPIGVTLAAPLTRDASRTSRLGQLVAEAIRRAAPDAQIGLMNAGGLRADLPKGPLTFGNLFEALPFEDEIVRLTLKGHELKRLLAGPERAGHGLPQTAGARLTRSHGQIELVLADGSAVDEEADYKVATNSFIAAGGDHTAPVLQNVGADRRAAVHVRVRDAVLQYLKALPQPVR